MRIKDYLINEESDEEKIKKLKYREQNNLKCCAVCKKGKIENNEFICTIHNFNLPVEPTAICNKFSKK